MGRAHRTAFRDRAGGHAGGHRAARGAGGLAGAAAGRLPADAPHQSHVPRAPLPRTRHCAALSRRRHGLRAGRPRAQGVVPGGVRRDDRRSLQRARRGLRRAAMSLGRALSCPERGGAGRDPRRVRQPVRAGRGRPGRGDPAPRVRDAAHPVCPRRSRRAGSALRLRARIAGDRPHPRPDAQHAAAPIGGAYVPRSQPRAFFRDRAGHPGSGRADRDRPARGAACGTAAADGRGRGQGARDARKRARPGVRDRRRDLRRDSPRARRQVRRVPLGGRRAMTMSSATFPIRRQATPPRSLRRFPRGGANAVTWPAVVGGAPGAVLAILQQLELTQWWPPEQLRVHQLRQAALLLAHAEATVPFYRERAAAFAAAGIRPGEALTEEAWQRVPILERRAVQDAGTALRSTTLPPTHGNVAEVVTTGSTGMPVRGAQDPARRAVLDRVHLARSSLAPAAISRASSR